MKPKSRVTNIELEGNMRHYHMPKPSREIQQFANLYKHNLPDSKRTLIPSFQPVSEKENIFHKANSFYSHKLNKNSIGPDFISYGDVPTPIQRKSAAKIMQESVQPRKIRELKPNVLHKKYVEYSQINNIPGPQIGKRIESNIRGGIEREEEIVNHPLQSGIGSGLGGRVGKNISPSCISKNTEIESFQRKVYRDYNSNVACLPGSIINAKEKPKTLVAQNTRKNESHIIFGDSNDNKNKSYNYNTNYRNNKNKYNDETFSSRRRQYLEKFYEKKENKIPRPVSFSGKKIIKNRNIDSFPINSYPYDENQNTMNRTNTKVKTEGGIGAGGYYDFAPSKDKQKYYLMKNRSQITFG